MRLQVFQSSFGVWALSVLGTTTLGTLGVPYLATEHRKKGCLWIISAEFIDFCPMAVLPFTLQSALQIL